MMTGDRHDADVAPRLADLPTLPHGLLERGVVVLQDWVWEIQDRDGRDISREVNSRFSANVKNVYDICWKGWQYLETNDYPDDQLDWDKSKIEDIAAATLYQAVLVAVRVRGRRDETPAPQARTATYSLFDTKQHRRVADSCEDAHHRARRRAASEAATNIM